ncbi:hypothetical protein [Burkholderia gladioli]|uniref:hypothetical protein n=1 Tax=Burkholderia gladioli TaxID=28095 RepID=UPI00164164AC|nr:hypothetical protein [Burkholderia gladioli]
MLSRMTNRTILLSAAMTLLAATAPGWVITYRFGWRLDLSVWSVLPPPAASASLSFVAFLVGSSGLVASIGSPLLAMHFVSQRAVVTKRIK